MRAFIALLRIYAMLLVFEVGYPTSSSSSVLLLLNKWRNRQRIPVENERLKELENNAAHSGPCLARIHTSNVTKFLTVSCRVCLLAFYDSDSIHEQELDPLEKAAFVLNSFPVAVRNMRPLIGIVDVAYDPLLMFLYAKEMKTTWTKNGFRRRREGEKRSERYPLILKLFRDGVVMEEYTGAIETNALVRYLRLHSIGGELAVVTIMEELINQPLPAVIGCNVNDHDEIALRSLAETFKGQVSFVLIRSQELCDEIIRIESPWSCPVQSASCTAREDSFLAIVTEPTGIVNSEAEDNALIVTLLPIAVADSVSLETAIRTSIDLLFHHMTPENSWKFMRTSGLLLILLVEDPLRFSERENRILSVMTRNRDKLEGATVTAFVYSDGPEFAEEFNVNTLPAVIVYSPLKRKVLLARSLKDVSEADIDRLVKELLVIERPKDHDLEARSSADVVEDSTAWNAFENLHLMIGRLIKLTMSMTDSDWDVAGLQLKDAVLSVLNRNPDHQEYLDFITSVWSKDDSLVFTSRQRNKWLHRMETFNDWLLRSVSDGKTPVTTRAFRNASEAIGLIYKEFIFRREDQYRKQKEISLEGNGLNGLLKEIPREDAQGLTVVDFMDKFVKAKSPIIITGLNPFPKGKEWWSKAKGFQPLLAGCDSSRSSSSQSQVKYPKYMEPDHHGIQWGGLKQVAQNEHITLEEFLLSSVRTNSTRARWYIHDNPLATLCPRLLLNFDNSSTPFYVPKYIAEDLLQRSPFDALVNSWPSLFIGANGTKSALHVDTAATSFTMYLVAGSKDWLIVDASAMSDVYMEISSERFNSSQVLSSLLLETGQESQLVVDERIAKFPLVVKAIKEGKVYRARQNPGEFLFIPSNSPHAAVNQEDEEELVTVGWSMNVVNEFTYQDHLREKLMGLRFRDFEEFTSKEVIESLGTRVHDAHRDVPFEEFKSWRRLRERKHATPH